MTARYDGHADWYDDRFRHYGDASAGLLAKLLGPPDPDDPRCLDIGCGTGLHTPAVQARGYTVIGLDLSADQLRLARDRNPRVIQADAAALPIRANSIPAVVMTFTHTDLDDFATVVAEAARVLRPGGRLIYLGLHPAFVGAFVDRTSELDAGRLELAAGYGDERLQIDHSGRFPVRSRVGARNLTLTSLLGAFLAQPSLRLTSLTEYDTRLQPWSGGATDGRLVPWNLVVTLDRPPSRPR